MALVSSRAEPQSRRAAEPAGCRAGEPQSRRAAEPATPQSRRRRRAGDAAEPATPQSRRRRRAGDAATNLSNNKISAQERRLLVTVTKVELLLLHTMLTSIKLNKSRPVPVRGAYRWH